MRRGARGPRATRAITLFRPLLVRRLGWRRVARSGGAVPSHEPAFRIGTGWDGWLGVPAGWGALCPFVTGPVTKKASGEIAIGCLFTDERDDPCGER